MNQVSAAAPALVASARIDGNFAPDLIDRGEWERRFKNRIVARLTDSKEFLDSSGVFGQKEAEDEASFEFNHAGYPYLSCGFETDPEGSADQALAGD